MSFQNFRLGELSMQQPLPPHLLRGTTTNINGDVSSQYSFDGSGKGKQPYGSGDQEDGYTLVFPNMTAFEEWRQREEESQCVEFVKGDTHGSKAVPPRFREHTKLVCARHSRSGRKKYIKKHPERVRKVPSRKLEGVGCPASISYKTYFDTEEVRACYVSNHSHEIGPANLPYTRRGRKEALVQERDRRQKQIKFANAGPSSPTPTSTSAGPSSAAQSSPFQTMMPGQPQQQAAFQPYPYNQSAFGAMGQQVSQDRWENMQSLFNHIRQHARHYEYPSASVAALETVLIRLYLESPVASVNQGMGPTSSAQMSQQIMSTQQTDQHSEGSMEGDEEEDS